MVIPIELFVQRQQTLLTQVTLFYKGAPFPSLRWHKYCSKSPGNSLTPPGPESRTVSLCTGRGDSVIVRLSVAVGQGELAHATRRIA